jgi:hypothetical protein
MKLMTITTKDLMVDETGVFCENLQPAASQQQSVPISNKVVSSNPVHVEVYLIQHYMIKVVSYLRQVGGFLH